VLASNSVSYGKAPPYLPVLEFLKAYSGIEAYNAARNILAAGPANRLNASSPR